MKQYIFDALIKELRHILCDGSSWYIGLVSGSQSVTFSSAC